MKSISRSLIALLLVAPIAAFANPEGRPGKAKTGCNPCHSSTANPVDRVCIAIPGLPAASGYVPDTEYDVTVFVDGLGVPPLGLLPLLGFPVAGYDLEVTGGTLQAIDGLSTVASLHEATHSTAGNKTNHWTLNWTSPSSGDVTFYLAAMPVNGDGQAVDDFWNKTEVTLTPASSGSAPVDGLFCNPPLPLPQLLPLPVGVE